MNEHRPILAAAIVTLFFSGWVVASSGRAMMTRFLTPPTCETAPIAPSDLVVVRVNPSQVDLRWNDNSSDEFGFEIWRWPDGIEYQDLRATVGSNITNYSDTDARINYWYWIEAWNNCGKSALVVYRPALTNPALTLTSTPMSTVESTPASTQSLPTPTATILVEGTVQTVLPPQTPTSAATPVSPTVTNTSTPHFEATPILTAVTTDPTSPITPTPGTVDGGNGSPLCGAAGLWIIFLAVLLMWGRQSYSKN